MNKEIISKLQHSFNEPSFEQQTNGCIEAIKETISYNEEVGSVSDFLIELRDFIIRYNEE